jgi:hypothetical protein
MPALAFLASVGLALVAMLFAANAMLPDNGPVIIVSERIGLPEPWHPAPDRTSPPTFVPIPAPEMTAQRVISAQTVSEAEGLAIKPAARAARAEAPPKREKRVARQSTDREQNHVQQNHVQQSSLVDRFTIRGQ